MKVLFVRKEFEIIILLIIIDWLFTDIVIHRNILPLWYIATSIVLGLSIFLSVLMKLKKFGFTVLLVGAVMSATWEIILFMFGLRSYDNPLSNLIGPIPELIFHSFAEMPATLLIGILAIYKLGIIDLEKFKDENWKKEKKILKGGPKDE